MRGTTKACPVPSECGGAMMKKPSVSTPHTCTYHTYAHMYPHTCPHHTHPHHTHVHTTHMYIPHTCKHHTHVHTTHMYTPHTCPHHTHVHTTHMYIPHTCTHMCAWTYTKPPSIDRMQGTCILWRVWDTKEWQLRVSTGFRGGGGMGGLWWGEKVTSPWGV